MVPGSHPFAELEAALIRSAPDPPSSLGEQLGDPGTGILRAALRVLDHDDDRLVVVIDQFEELFTLTEDDAVRSSFLDGLVTAVDDPRRRVVVILTLRADYYHLTLDHAEFSTRFGHGVVNVGPLLPEELESAALLPAQRMGVEIEPALLGTLLSEVIGRPGNLPLFQYTLTDLFDRGGAMLTLEDYEAVGGIAGALARRAEDAYGGFDPDDQAACKQVLMRMVAVGEEGFARRRLSVDGLRALGIDAAAIQRIVGALVDARLVTTDRDQRTGRPTIEVAHEALLAAWPRLAGWLEDASDDLRRHAFLAAAVAEWEASGRDPEYLWHGRRLEDHRSWAADSSLDLSVDEQRFLTEAALRDQEAERARARARRSTRIRTSILAAAVVALVAIGGFVVYQAVQPKPLEVMLLDAPGGGSASASAFAGIEAVADRLDVGVRRIRPGIDTGPEIEAAIAALPDYVVIGRDAAKAFGPFYFEAITERLDTTRFLDFSFGGVEPEGDHPNWTRVAFDQAEAGFLAGVLAAGRTETGVVGFVGGHAAIMEDLRGGFEIGVASVDPSIEVVSAYSPITSVPPLSVYDEASAEQAFETTLRVLDAGADVVLNGHGDAGIGVFRAVASSARDAWAIGVASDQYSDLVESEQRTADHVLASIVYRYDVAIPWAIQRSRAGNDASGDAGLTIGAIDVADPSGNLTEAELASLASATELIIAEGSPDTGLDPRPESWGEAVLPRHGPTELPPDADVIHIALTAEEGMTVTDPGALAVGDTVTAQMDIESQTYWWYWVTIGRLTDLVEERPLPPALDGPGWLQPDYWDIRLPRNWMAIPGRGSSAAMSVVLDRPGTWAVAIGRFDEPGLLSPVEWRTFEVLPASG
jgi:basic membrane lipoprotein Med (substrate-binding protein (PBP1-ABC) superfamily)